MWEYGIQGGAFVTISQIELGLIAGWMHSEWDLEFKNGGSFGPDSIALDLEQEGVFVGFSIGGVL